MPFEVPALSFEYDAIEPLAAEGSLREHHLEIHGAHVHRINELAERAGLDSRSLEAVLADIRSATEDIRQQVRNHGGGHLNHSLFWETLSPGGGGEPVGRLRDAVEYGFGSVGDFREAFTREALGRFASGWAWLAMDHNGAMNVLSTPNEDSPLMYGYRPLLALDLWEHAYLRKHGHRRDAYVEAWWKLVNWTRVAELHAANLEIISRPGQR